MTARSGGRRQSASGASRLWAAHDREFRDPAAVATQWQQMGDVDPRLLEVRVRGPFWDLIDEARVTLVATREYEHLVTAIGHHRGRRRISYLRMPHPNGLAQDSRRGLLHVASTRNPNMVLDLAPAARVVAGRGDPERMRGLLLPVRSRSLPGALYVHDLAMIGGALHANGVGLNAVVRLPEEGGYEPVWWPRCIDRRSGGPRFEVNYLQLNSIAAGRSLETSLFTASAAAPSARRPGHLNFPVDGRGVVFSGRTREVLAGGLTRPHSARRWQRRVWIDNSGYGELCVLRGSRIETVARLPGWTRGLCFSGGIAFVGTSRVIPRYRHYAPGLDVERSVCGISAVELATGRVLASLRWPHGNQLFAIEALPAATTHGFPFVRSDAANERFLREFFSAASG